MHKCQEKVPKCYETQQVTKLKKYNLLPLKKAALHNDSSPEPCEKLLTTLFEKNL